jgi:predicted nucleotidyltransferase
VEQTELLRFTLQILEKLGIPYMLVGSFASTTYGEPRFTQDIDIVVELEKANVTEFCNCFPSPEFYVSEAAVRDAVHARFQFNILHTTSGNKIDFLFPKKDEWGRTQLHRRRKTELLPSFFGYAASPEDVILGKLWYHAEGGSDKHLRDIAGMLRISGDSIDRELVRSWAEKMGYAETWQAILDTLEQTKQPGH